MIRFSASLKAEHVGRLMLFFSSIGMAYKLKVWRLPEARIAGKGKAMVNLLPLAQGERITAILALPDENEWEKLHVVFATKSGDVRRNALSDFVQVNKNGKIAMKLADGDGIVGVATCTDDDDVLLTTRNGRCIRFSLSDLRVFQSRASTGVRGIKLGAGDEVVSLSLLRHTDIVPAEATAYLRQSNAARRAVTGEEVEQGADDAAEEPVEEATLTPERYAELGAREQFVLTVSGSGFGKRTSSYEYRVMGRGGAQGVWVMDMKNRNKTIVASFSVEESDDLMLISDGGQTIRVPVAGIRVAGRATQGVTVFKVDDGEKVVSVERIADVGGETA